MTKEKKLRGKPDKPLIHWTSEMDQTVKNMTADGKSRQEVAKHLTIMFGVPISKNAVCGRASRIGATSLRSLNRSTKTKSKNTRVYGWQHVRPDEEVIVIETKKLNGKKLSEIPETKNKKFFVPHVKEAIRHKPITIPTNPGRPGGCQFLKGEAAERNFCGQKTVKGSATDAGSWCSEHYAVVYERIVKLVAKDGKGPSRH